VSRLRAGRHVGTLPPLGEWELLWAWGGQHRRDVIHAGGVCDGIGCWSKFDSEEDREAAWWALRDELLHSLHVGCRPAAFWYYEAESLCGHEPRCPKWPKDELAWLVEHGQATPRERRMSAKERKRAAG
jgi:hypothetical protein